MSLIKLPALDVLIDATGSPPAGIQHATAAIEHGKHLVMVNVETDALVGPLLAERAKAAGLVYSLAYGVRSLGSSSRLEHRRSYAKRPNSISP